MPEHYDADNSNSSPPVAEKKKREGVKMTDKQKADLKKHMGKSGLTGSEAKSHRMKMMSRMRKGESIAKAHKGIMKSK